MTVKLRPTKTEISQLKKGEAVEILKDLGLSSDGNRTELQSRIRTCLLYTSPSPRDRG